MASESGSTSHLVGSQPPSQPSSQPPSQPPYESVRTDSSTSIAPSPKFHHQSPFYHQITSHQLSPLPINFHHTSQLPPAPTSSIDWDLTSFPTPLTFAWSICSAGKA